MPVDDPGHDVGKIYVGLDVDQFAAFDERGDDRPGFCPSVRSGEECVLAGECDGADGTLDDVGVDLDTAVIQEVTEALPARQGVTDRLGELGFLTDHEELVAQPWLQGLDHWLALRQPHGAAGIGALASDIALDAIEFGDACERLVCDGSQASGGEFVEAAAYGGPAKGE